MRNIPGVARTFRWIIAIALDQFFIAFDTKRGVFKREKVETVFTLFNYL